ncbi:hypothetical protein FKM82_014518 [Ascaphus truei]
MPGLVQSRYWAPTARAPGMKCPCESSEKKNKPSLKGRNWASKGAGRRNFILSVYVCMCACLSFSLSLSLLAVLWFINMLIAMLVGGEKACQSDLSERERERERAEREREERVQ